MNTSLSKQTVGKRTKTTCSVCDSTDLSEILPLPGLPLTGIFVSGDCDSSIPNVDQALVLCDKCGHAQLLFFLDPDFVYGSTYTHRSSLSPISTTGNDFFATFLLDVIGTRSFRRILEVGCNDLYLLRRLEGLGDTLVGIDPIWRGRETPDGSKIRVIGDYVEHVDISGELGGPPDLVLSVHTFEHLDSPKHQLLKLVQLADDDAVFVVEVPGFDTLLSTHRFDQVFHQHIQYFSLASFVRMLHEVGADYLTHTFNYSYWGGTMLVAFRKSGTRHGKSTEHMLGAPRRSSIQESHAIFRNLMDLLMQTIHSLPQEPIYGYGAAQMVPTLAYHMKSDLSFLECILDDNPQKDGLKYPSLPVKIRCPEADFSLQEANVLVTALDSARSVLGRVFSLRARRVIVPVNIV